MAGRVVALAILAGVLAILYFGALMPALAFYRDRQAQLDTDILLDRRLRQVAAEVPGLQVRAAALRQNQNIRTVALEGGNDALASASLQTLVEGAAASAGVNIASTEGIPAEPRGDYRRIGLRVAIVGTYENLIQLLLAIESMKPPLAVSGLQIHGKPVVGASQDNAQLDAALSVYGFRSIGSGDTKR